MIDLDYIQALSSAAGIDLPVQAEMYGCSIISADSGFVIYDEGGHTAAQAQYVAALITAAPDLIAIARAAADSLKLRQDLEASEEARSLAEQKVSALTRSGLLPVAGLPKIGGVDRYEELEREHLGDIDKGTGIYAAAPASQAAAPAGDAQAQFEAWANKQGRYDLRPAKWKVKSVGGVPYDGYVRPYLQDRTVHAYEGFCGALSPAATPVSQAAAQHVAQRYADILRIQRAEAESGDAYMVGLYNGMAMMVANIDNTEFEPLKLAGASPVPAAPQWISVKDRLPPAGELVLVFYPNRRLYDWPDSVNIDLDCIDPNDDDHASWVGHNELYEHYSCVACEGMSGPSEKAPYTHWCSIPASPAPVESSSTNPNKEAPTP